MAINRVTRKDDKRTLNCPRKLEVGMKVVVKIKLGTHLLPHELDVATKTGEWFKAELVSIWKDLDMTLYRIKYSGIETAFRNMHVLIIRSTALEDNLTPGEIRSRLDAAARKQRAKIAASVKVKSYKIGDTTYNC